MRPCSSDPRALSLPSSVLPESSASCVATCCSWCSRCASVSCAVRPWLCGAWGSSSEPQEDTPQCRYVPARCSSPGGYCVGRNLEEPAGDWWGENWLSSFLRVMSASAAAKPVSPESLGAWKDLGGDITRKLALVCADFEPVRTNSSSAASSAASSCTSGWKRGSTVSRYILALLVSVQLASSTRGPSCGWMRAALLRGSRRRGVQSMTYLEVSPRQEKVSTFTAERAPASGSVSSRESSVRMISKTSCAVNILCTR
mmetsp:Transcript_32639/g.71808  ORF Transcript_32639/g.71808 Transcript_32639/m.71808 type:complete len:257 (+) Transcript_32639:96-866(+)